MLYFCRFDRDCCIMLEPRLNEPRASRFARRLGFVGGAKLTYKYVNLAYAFRANKSWDVHLYCALMACGDGRVATKANYVEILNFRHFFKHIVFTSEGDKIRNKEIKNYINVSVVVDIECGNTNN